MARTKASQAAKVWESARQAIADGKPVKSSISGISIFTVKNYLKQYRNESGERVTVKVVDDGFQFSHNQVLFKVKELVEIIEEVGRTGHSYFFNSTSVNYGTLTVEISRFNSRTGAKVVGVKKGEDEGEKFFEVFRGKPAAPFVNRKPVSMIFTPLNERVVTTCRQLVSKKNHKSQVVVYCSETEKGLAIAKISELNEKLPDGGKMVFEDAERQGVFVGLSVKLENYVDPFSVIDEETDPIV